jgi:hypothetical protein
MALLCERVRARGISTSGAKPRWADDEHTRWEEGMSVMFVVVGLKILELRRAGVRIRWCVAVAAAAVVMERLGWVGMDGCTYGYGYVWSEGGRCSEGLLWWWACDEYFMGHGGVRCLSVLDLRGRTGLVMAYGRNRWCFEKIVHFVCAPIAITLSGMGGHGRMGMLEIVMVQGGGVGLGDWIAQCQS